MVWESIKDQNASQYYSVSLQGSRFEALSTLDKNLRGLLFLITIIALCLMDQLIIGSHGLMWTSNINSNRIQPIYSTA